MSKWISYDRKAISSKDLYSKKTNFYSVNRRSGWRMLMVRRDVWKSDQYLAKLMKSSSDTHLSDRKASGSGIMAAAAADWLSLSLLSSS